jgi:small conductance mechanosensitive channel
MDWEQIGVAAAVVLVTLVVARIVDGRMRRFSLDPASATRYRVLRRTVTSVIVTVGVLSALLTLDPVRTVAGGVLASTAVLGLVLGFAAQRTLSNFVAGILIAIAQPLRLGDRVRVDNDTGQVEEIGLTYTFIRLDDGARLVIPNDKLASDTIRNSTIRRAETVAEIQVQVPLTQDVETAVEALRDEISDLEGGRVVLSSLEGNAVVTVRAPAVGIAVEELAHELRLRAHRRLRREGVFA